jgi:hypothetical protein
VGVLLYGRQPPARPGWYCGLVPIVSFLRKHKHALTPPGNRPSIDAAGETRDAPTGMEPQSMGGEKLHEMNRWSGGP